MAEILFVPRTADFGDDYTFSSGGDGDSRIYDFVNDPHQGFGVPAKSLTIFNHGGGAGSNLIYYKISRNGDSFSRKHSIDPDAGVNYLLGETVIYGLMIWASNANCSFSFVATPGEWLLKDAKKYEPNPIKKRQIEYLVTNYPVI
jgi:hypothetical protein